jgi:PTS system nitrogen regulatory IIA component
MALTDFLTEGRVWLDFTAGNKAEVLAGLSRLAAGAGGWPPEEVLAVLAAREEMGSTGFGGVALPHGRLAGLTSPFLALALAPGGWSSTAWTGCRCGFWPWS